MRQQSHRMSQQAQRQRRANGREDIQADRLPGRRAAAGTDTSKPKTAAQSAQSRHDVGKGCQSQPVILATNGRLRKRHPMVERDPIKHQCPQHHQPRRKQDRTGPRRGYSFLPLSWIISVWTSRGGHWQGIMRPERRRRIRRVGFAETCPREQFSLLQRHCPRIKRSSPAPAWPDGRRRKDLAGPRRQQGLQQFRRAAGARRVQNQASWPARRTARSCAAKALPSARPGTGRCAAPASCALCRAAWMAAASTSTPANSSTKSASSMLKKPTPQ